MQRNGLSGLSRQIIKAPIGCSWQTCAHRLAFKLTEGRASEFFFESDSTLNHDGLRASRAADTGTGNGSYERGTGSDVVLLVR